MGLDCRNLFLQTYAGNENSTKLYLEEDFTSIFDERLWTDSFPIAVIIWCTILIVISSFIACIYHPLDIIKHKRIKLLARENTHSKPQINAIFNLYTKGSQDIIDLITEYADIEWIEDLDKNLNYCRITCGNTTTSRDTKVLLIMYIFISTIITASAIPIYLVSAHINDSYLSYLKAECTYYNPSSSVLMEISLNGGHCMDNTYQYIEGYSLFSESNHVSFDMIGQDIKLGSHNCYINVQDFSVRRPIYNIGTEGFLFKCGDDHECKNCSRCGKGCYGCCYAGCCECCNCCGYCWCLCCACGGIACACVWCCRTSDMRRSMIRSSEDLREL